MKHCIRMYWHQYNLGKSAVFSLMTNTKKCLTIEINPIKKIGEVRVCIHKSHLTLVTENEFVFIPLFFSIINSIMIFELFFQKVIGL